MLVFKSFLSGAALAGLFEIYVDQISRKNTAAITSNLIALALVFLVSNLLHWLAFRNPGQRSVIRKLAFSLGLWFSFFLCWMIVALTLHRGIALGDQPTPFRMLSLFLSCMGVFGLPLAFLNCFIANWSEPMRRPSLKSNYSVRALVRKLTDSSAA
jgi:hypothetical protein